METAGKLDATVARAAQCNAEHIKACALIQLIHFSHLKVHHEEPLWNLRCPKSFQVAAAEVSFQSYPRVSQGINGTLRCPIKVII